MRKTVFVTALFVFRYYCSFSENRFCSLNVSLIAL